jgi:hypothetical protein
MKNSTHLAPGGNGNDRKADVATTTEAERRGDDHRAGMHGDDKRLAESCGHNNSTDPKPQEVATFRRRQIEDSR